MKKLMMGLFSLLLAANLWASNNRPVIDGLWESQYDASHTPSSHIRITTKPNGELMGVIEKAYPRPGEHPSPNCTQCEGENKDKPIVGLTILWGMKPVGHNEWKEGHVLDAETGKIYSGALTLSDDGNELDLRGYVLHPIFGETAVWKRVK